MLLPASRVVSTLSGCLPGQVVPMSRVKTVLGSNEFTTGLGKASTAYSLLDFITKNRVRRICSSGRAQGVLTVLGGTQFQISPGPYEVTSVNKLMSSGLSVGQTVSRWVGPEIHDIPWCLAQESFRSWGGLPRVELRGILRMCAHSSSGCWEGRIWNLAVSSNRRYHRSGQVQSSAVQDQLGP